MPAQGDTLTTTTGTWTQSPSSFGYQWKRGGVAIGGATSSSYLIAAADVGTTLTVTVTATNASGSVPATSAATGTVTGAGAGTALSASKTPPILTLESGQLVYPPVIGAEIDSTHSAGDTVRFFVTDHAGIIAPATITRVITSADTTTSSPISVGFSSYSSGTFDVEADVINAAGTLYSGRSNSINFGPPPAVLSDPVALSSSATSVNACLLYTSPSPRDS